MYPSLPKAWTPLSYTHWKQLLYFPVLTSSWCKISLWWIFCGGKGGTPGQSELSLQHKGFPELSSLISTGFLESRDDKTGPNSQFKQVPADSCVHCTERIIQEVDVCVLIHGSRKHRETSGEDTSHCLGLISESWWCLTTPGSFYKPRERAKTLLHTGPPCERGLCAQVH